MATEKFPKARRQALAKEGKTGLPNGKYPMPDKAHAANAKSRASQMEKAGKLSAGQKATIDAKANKILGKGKGS